MGDYGLCVRVMEEFELDIRSSSLFVVPELQFGIFAGLFGALGVFALRNKGRSVKEH